MSIRSKFKVDITTGQVTRYINNTLVATALTAKFFSRDKVPIEVQYYAGNSDVTTDILASGAIQRVGIRRYTGTGDILAQADTYSLVSGAAQTILDLNTEAMVAYMDQLADPQNEKPAYLEFEVTSADGTTRITACQVKATIGAEVNMQGDLPPASPTGGTLHFVAVPATPTSTGAVNDASFDDSYFYLCVAPNTWRRFALNEWS